MEWEKEQINEYGDYEIIENDPNGCKICGASLDLERAIKGKNGDIYCYSCSKRVIINRCSECDKAFKLGNYVDYDYYSAKEKALEDRRACEASHIQDQINTKQREQEAKELIIERRNDKAIRELKKRAWKAGITFKKGWDRLSEVELDKELTELRLKVEQLEAEQQQTAQIEIRPNKN